MNKKDHFFLKRSKADVIEALSKKKLKFIIPLTYSFSIKDWNRNKGNILKKIQKTFKEKKYIAIRSSSKSEDKSNNSSAGKFSSFLDIPINNKKKIFSAILNVIKSYKNSIQNDDQVFIQEMITNVSISGVVFTKDIDTGLNYYVINYDDITGKTNTVTSGYGAFANRTLFIFRKYKKKIKSLRFKKLIECVHDLENKIDNNEIDLEFAITKNLKPYLFQARPISTQKNWKPININKHEKYIIKAEKKLTKIFKRKVNVLGNKTVFGQMPDWNPVEMIGKFPSNLSYSLYEKLITKDIWAKSRAIMGYRNMAGHKLMEQISGQPYIDTRLSLNSFLPKKLPKEIGYKIIDYGIEKLKKKPQFHDKIEFEISTPSYNFDTKYLIAKRFKSILTKKQQITLVKELKELTLSFLDESNNFSISKELKKINKLDNNFNSFKKKNIKLLPKLILICKNLGTLNFSILARHGFVAKSFLNSMINQKILSQLDVEKFEQSLNTITKQMLTDLSLVGEKKISQKNFMLKYGHLRPGTYDICSMRYDQIKNFNFKVQNLKKDKSKFVLSKKKIFKIDRILKKENFRNINTQIFFEYLSNAISLREYSKFIFTKYLSQILEIIAHFGKIKKLRREDLMNLNINNFLNKNIYSNLYKLKKISLINKKKYKMNKIVKLPILIQDISGTRVIPYQLSSPNFITQKKAKGPIIFQADINNHKNLDKKIILIENADPGYDWIFGYQISGLITKYGGINSHMSIRCSELSIPAVIGCGEQIFSDLLNKKEIQIDCSSSIIYSV